MAAAEQREYPGVISAQRTDGPSMSEVPETLGGPADPTPLTNEMVVDILEGYRTEAEYARLAGPNSRDRTWLEHWDLYYNRWDFSKKASWQAHEVMPEFPQYVDRFAAAMRMALVAQPEFFTISCDNDEEGDLAYVIRKYMNVILRRIGRNPSNQRTDFSALFEEAMKMGALSMIALKVTQKPDGKGSSYTSAEVVDPYNIYLDPTGRGLYRRHREEMDLHELRALIDVVDEKGNPLFDREAITMAISEPNEESLMRIEREKRTGTGQWMTSNRRTVMVDEWYCDLVDNEGYVRAKNCLFVVVNQRWLIRGQVSDDGMECGDPNPFWHDRDWMVITPIITVPLAPYGRSYAENFASLTRTFNEMTNLILDSIMVSTMKIFGVVPDYLEDPGQIENGISPMTLFRFIEGIETEQAIKAIDMGNVNPQAFDVWKLLKQELQEGAAFNEMTLGNAAPQGRTSATEISTVDQNSTQYMRAIASNIETLALEPALDLIWKTSLQHLDKNDKEIELAVGQQWFKTFLKMKKKFCDYKVTFVCRGITSLLARKQKLQEFLQFLQICTQNPEMAQVLTSKWPAEKLFAYTAMLMDVDVNQLEGTPREMQMQQAQTQQKNQQNQQDNQRKLADMAKAKGMAAQAEAPAKIAVETAKQKAQGDRETKQRVVDHVMNMKEGDHEDIRELRKSVISKLLGLDTGEQRGQPGEGGGDQGEQGGGGNSAPSGAAAPAFGP